MNPAEVVKKALNEHFNETRFNARLVPNEALYVLEVKFADRGYHRSVSFPKDMTRREVSDMMTNFIIEDFMTTFKGKRYEAHRPSSR